MEEEKIYLKNGIDTWFELVNQYWHGYRSEGLSGFSFPTADIPSESLLTRIVYQNFQNGYSKRFHEDATKTHMCFLGSVINRLGALNELRSKYMHAFPKLDTISLERAYADLSYKHSGDIEIPEHLIPKDREYKDIPPILIPFMPAIKRLEDAYAQEISRLPIGKFEKRPSTEEVEKLSPDLEKLIGDAFLAGESAVYQNVPIFFDQWSSEAYRFMQEYQEFAKSAGLKEPPQIQLISLSNSHDLMNHDARLHSRFSPPSFAINILKQGIDNSPNILTEYISHNSQHQAWGYLIWKRTELQNKGIKITSFFDEAKKFKSPQIEFSSSVRIADNTPEAYPLFYKAASTALINSYIHFRLQQTPSQEALIAANALPENKGVEFSYPYVPDYTFRHESLTSSSGIFYSESVEPLISAWRLEDRSKDGQGNLLLLRN